MMMESKVPIVMGILNVTPDSFSDGGEFNDAERAFVRAKEMVEEGARIIDIGGESSGPGSVDVSLEEEMRRVLPMVEMLAGFRRREFGEGEGFLISVDTYKSVVAEKALEIGGDIINDVTGLRGDDRMGGVLAKVDAKVVLMYSKDDSARTSTDIREYEDVVGTIKSFLSERIDYAISVGIKRENIILDPGMGAFVSMNPEYSYEILERLKEFEDFGLPVLIGASRKSFLGGKINERLDKGLECAMKAVKNGASIIRTHDVKETVEALAGI